MTIKNGRPRAALYHPPLADFAGGEMVGAWILQVLTQKYDTILWCDRPPDFGKMDARFGTKLASRPPVAVEHRSGKGAWLQRIWPGSGRLLADSLVVRDLKRLDRRWQPRVWVSSMNEMWMPKAGLQYIHHPDKQRVLLTAAEWSWPRRAAYGLSQTLAGKVGVDTVVPPLGHRSVANSHWTARQVLKRTGREPAVVYPPVPPFASGRSWSERENRVVCLGRWNPQKRMETVIDIVAQARQLGASDLRLSFVGFWHATETEREAVLRRCAGLDWIDWHERLDRNAVQELVGRSRFGLHAMIDEHFGIALAEMMTAGCIVFAHDSGGPPEILGDRRQLYANVEAGARMLHAVWRSSDLQDELHRAARPRGLRFSPEVFCAAIEAEIAACDPLSKRP